MEINSKICTGCKKDKPFSEYTSAKLGKYGLRAKCKSCRATDAYEFNLTRKEEISAHGKKYREENAERISIQRAEHTKRNKERLSEYQKQWRLDNPGKSNARTARRRAARKRAVPKWLTKEHNEQIIDRYDEAIRTTKETGIPYEVDHEIPLQGKNVKGLHVPWNLKVIPRSENRRKSRKIL
jgi:hypothetical protein